MDQKLKQRLVGAIVLVSLAVIFIPIILEGPDDEWTPRSHNIPEPPQMDYRASMQLPLPAETPAPAAGPDSSAPAGVAITPLATPPPMARPEAAPEPAPESAPKPEPVAVAKPAPPPAETAGSTAALPAGWYVQVGSFSQQPNASGLRDRLKSAGYAARLQATGSTFRVLVGPSDTRGEAEKQRDRLLAKQQLKGIVIQLSG